MYSPILIVSKPAVIDINSVSTLLIEFSIPASISDFASDAKNQLNVSKICHFLCVAQRIFWFTTRINRQPQYRKILEIQNQTYQDDTPTPNDDGENTCPKFISKEMYQ